VPHSLFLKNYLELSIEFKFGRKNQKMIELCGGEEGRGRGGKRRRGRRKRKGNEGRKKGGKEKEKEKKGEKEKAKGKTKKRGEGRGIRRAGEESGELMNNVIF